MDVAAVRANGPFPEVPLRVGALVQQDVRRLHSALVEDVGGLRRAGLVVHGVQGLLVGFGDNSRGLLRHATLRGVGYLEFLHDCLCDVPDALGPELPVRQLHLVHSVLQLGFQLLDLLALLPDALQLSPGVPGVLLVHHSQQLFPVALRRLRVRRQVRRVQNQVRVAEIVAVIPLRILAAGLDLLHLL